MKLRYEVPEEEASKLRLIAKLPKGIRGGVAFIVDTAGSWEEAKKHVTEFLDAMIMDIQSIKVLFKSKTPVGPQRKKKRPE